MFLRFNLQYSDCDIHLIDGRWSFPMVMKKIIFSYIFKLYFKKFYFDILRHVYY